jgi:hypothetical protein
MKNSQQQSTNILTIGLVSLCLLLEVVYIGYIITDTTRFILDMFNFAFVNIPLGLLIKDFKGSEEEIKLKAILTIMISWVLSLLGWIVVAVSYFILFS